MVVLMPNMVTWPGLRQSGRVYFASGANAARCGDGIEHRRLLRRCQRYERVQPHYLADRLFCQAASLGIILLRFRFWLPLDIQRTNVCCKTLPTRAEWREFKLAVSLLASSRVAQANA